MTTYNDTPINTPLVINQLTQDQFDNATSIAEDELYLVDPEFTGGKVLATNNQGEIVETDTNVSLIERKVVTDLTSTSITLANAEAGTTYKYGTLTALTITANDTADNEINIYFTADSTGISVSLPATIEYIGSTPYFEAGEKYVISILNNILVSGRVA